MNSCRFFTGASLLVTNEMAVWPVSAAVPAGWDQLFPGWHLDYDWAGKGLPILDDSLDTFFTQASSQWDGLTHVGDYEHGFWGGVKNEDLRYSHDKSKLGIDHWARRGIAGRALILDVADEVHNHARPVTWYTAKRIPRR